MEYYIIEFVYQRKQYYFIWETNEIDRFLADNNKILFWKQKRDVMGFSKINNIVFEEQEQIRYDLDECEKWCQSLSADILIIKKILLNGIYCFQKTVLDNN